MFHSKSDIVNSVLKGSIFVMHYDIIGNTLVAFPRCAEYLTGDLCVPGRCPFVGFFHASEGVEQARLDRVFRGVASKVKDTVFSTIG